MATVADGRYDMPPFHVCQSLTAENGKLNDKYNKLKRKYKELYQEMLEMKEQLVRNEIHNQYAGLKKEIEQKDIRRKVPSRKPEPKKEVTDKIVPLYDALMKRYETEVKLNRNQSKKMNKLQIENEKLKEELFKQEQESGFLRKQLTDKDTMLRNMASVNNNSHLTPKQENKFRELATENDRLRKENGKLKDELRGLDKSFFEELEDMKYALHQSTKLNQEYERTLKQICKQTGQNYKQYQQKQPSKRQHSTPN